MNSLSDPETKILHHPGRLAQMKGVFDKIQFVPAYPISAEIDLTWQCALNCKLCHSKHLHQGLTLEPDQIRRILFQLHQHGLQSVTWAGGGEPLESPHWRYAVNLAHDLGIDQGLYSYLPKLDQEMADFLGDKMEFVYTHSCNTKGLQKPFGGRTTWTYGFLLDSDNWQRIPEMAAKVNWDFFDFADFRPLAPENKLDPTVLDYSWIPEGLKVLEETKRRWPKVRWTDYKFTRMESQREYDKCFSTDLTTCVGPDGTVWECLNRRGFPDSILGNLLREDLSSIWARKSRCRTDLKDCRLQCRNDSANRTLYKIFGEPIKHVNFV